MTKIEKLEKEIDAIYAEISKMNRQYLDVMLTKSFRAPEQSNAIKNEIRFLEGKLRGLEFASNVVMGVI